MLVFLLYFVQDHLEILARVLREGTFILRYQKVISVFYSVLSSPEQLFSNLYPLLTDPYYLPDQRYILFNFPRAFFELMNQIRRPMLFTLFWGSVDVWCTAFEVELLAYTVPIFIRETFN